MGLWLRPEPLVLASKSAARRGMLQAAGIPVAAHPADIDERGIEAGSDQAGPGDVAALLAREKALAVSAAMPDRLVVGADQTLAVGTTRFSKPADRDAARLQLKLLRGRSHELHSAVALVSGGLVVFRANAVATMTMRAFSDETLDRYLDATGAAVTSSVGGYQIEGIGIQLFERIDGDHFTILGLPLLPLLAALREAGALA
jgi:septum formation protein